jgi:hypothetical protein
MLLENMSFLELLTKMQYKYNKNPMKNWVLRESCENQAKTNSNGHKKSTRKSSSKISHFHQSEEKKNYNM